MTVAALAAVPLLLAGCGSEGANETGTGQAAEPSTSAPSPSTSSGPGASGHHGRPKSAPWPDYPAQDYTYQLRVTCFCPYAGVPFRVSVRDDEVTDVVYARSARGHRAGEPVPLGWLRLTIDDIIDRANDPSLADVKVLWPPGQAHPVYVWTDPVPNTVDDEVGYRISKVRPAG